MVNKECPRNEIPRYQVGGVSDGIGTNANVTLFNHQSVAAPWKEQAEITLAPSLKRYQTRNGEAEQNRAWLEAPAPCP